MTTTSGTTTTISGTVPATGSRVELFENPSCADPEGKTLLTAIPNASGTPHASL